MAQPIWFSVTTDKVIGDYVTKYAYNRFLALSKRRAQNRLWPKIVKELRHNFRLNFDSEGAYWSGGWAPLRPGTEHHKTQRTRLGHAQVGFDSGMLYSALVHGGPGNIDERTVGKLRYGVDGR